MTKKAQNSKTRYLTKDQVQSVISAFQSTLKQVDYYYRLQPNNCDNLQIMVIIADALDILEKEIK